MCDEPSFLRREPQLIKAKQDAEPLTPIDQPYEKK